MSLSGGFVFLFIALARLALRRAPKRCTLVLWAVLLVRLLVPLALESPFTLLPVYARPVSMQIYTELQPSVHTGIEMLNTAVSSGLPAATPHASMNPMQGYVLLATAVWLLGVALGLGYLLASSLRLRRRLGGARLLRDNIYLVAGLVSPFVAGVFRPRIYLPEGLDETETACIVSHEQSHIQRRDPLWRLLGFLALCLHWFNPLIWAAFFLSARDLEMACDERAAQGETQAYCTCLLRMAAGKPHAGLTPTAFSEGGVGARIRRILRYKKPPCWARAALLALVAVCGAAMLTNPVSAVRTHIEITRLSYGQEMQTVRADALGEAAIMDVMVKSSAFEAAGSIETTPMCYRIRQTLREGWHTETHDYYAYELDAQEMTAHGLFPRTAVMQHGSFYTVLNSELFAELEALF